MSGLDALSLRVCVSGWCGGILGLEPGERSGLPRELGPSAYSHVSWELEQRAGERPSGTLPSGERTGAQA